MRTLGIVIASLLFAHQALAIDCTAATSDAEKAICSDPAARSADERLGAAYTRLRKSLTGDAAAELRRLQSEWIRVRDVACSSPAAIKPLSACLAERSGERERYLDGRPLTGDVTDSIFQRIIIARPAKNGSARLSISAVKFIGPGDWQAPLNAMIDSEIKKALSDVAAGKENPGSRKGYEVELEIDVTYASPQLISVHVGSVSWFGQAHPNSGSYNINFDRTKKRELMFSDLLDGTRAKPIFEYCRSEVAKQKKERPGQAADWKDDVELKEVGDNTSSLKSWSFNASAAEVDYGAYAFGGYGQCMCSCTIPYSMLRPIAKPEFPLP